jgi:hypothetical protein
MKRVRSFRRKTFYGAVLAVVALLLVRPSTGWLVRLLPRGNDGSHGTLLSEESKLGDPEEAIQYKR